MHYSIMPPAVTVVIPVLCDAHAASALLAGLPPAPEVDVIVVDGGADPRLEPIVAAYREHKGGGVTLLRATTGRACQMNAGAAAATGEWILFLHADCSLPTGWLPAITGLDRDVIGGWFRFALDDPAWQARVIERLTAWRVKLLLLPYGDQGVFVRRQVFEQLRGFRELPLMEDVEFVRRLVRAGRVASLPLPLRTSARRWRRDGWFRRSTTNLLLVTSYFLGLNPERLARWYRSAARE
jgi:rSAM/selenodomain-associated transferase 2